MDLNTRCLFGKECLDPVTGRCDKMSDWIQTCQKYGCSETLLKKICPGYMPAMGAQLDETSSTMDDGWHQWYVYLLSSSAVVLLIAAVLLIIFRRNIKNKCLNWSSPTEHEDTGAIEMTVNVTHIGSSLCREESAPQLGEFAPSAITSPVVKPTHNMAAQGDSESLTMVQPAS